MIYLIAYVHFDDDNYRHETVDEDFGYFTSREDAQAWINSKQNLTQEYIEYVERMVARNVKAETDFEATCRAYDLLVEKDVKPPFFRPARASTVQVLEFPEWKRQNERFAIVEVEPNGE